ncbi:uncharacterized protein K02A2.6-like [Ostrea edulis]|uniref:uncharacterized protein K02A2.6-like n=1 Tax=Ostrea edulis TaxID=37623 RepID=UPI0024AEBF8D|nr:uncharacterized protein K02A2.6-like [Ostrea edulis]
MESLTGATPKVDWESGDLPGTWKKFKAHTEFMFNGPLKDKTEEEKCSYLMIWVGEKGRDIYSTWHITNEERKKLETYYTKFQAYFQPKSNKIFSRYKFNCRTQQENETCDEFLTALKVLVKDCGYANSEEMLRDRIVFGVRSAKIREKLITTGSDLSLNQAIDIANLYELSRAQLKTMSEDSKGDLVGNEVNRITTNYKGKQSDFPKCRQCGNRKHEAGERCVAIGKTCSSCGKRNHFARVCESSVKTKRSEPGAFRGNSRGKYYGKQSRRQKNRPVNMIQETDSDDNDLDDGNYFFMGMIDADINTIENWTTSLRVGDTDVQFLMDTGAKCNVITRDTYRRLKITTALEKAEALLKSYSGHKITADGMLTIPLKCNGQTHSMKFYIVDRNAPNILGADACHKLDLVRPMNAISSKTEIVKDNLQTTGSDILSEPQYAELFEGLGCLPGKYSIKLDPSVTPTIHPPRKVPISLKDKVYEELQRMEELGVIERQTEPTPWVNSMTVVNKGSKIRICIDPRDLNNAIQREHFPLKTVEDVIENMSQAKYFTKLDAVSGFWQIQLDEQSSRLCTFNSPFGRFRFKRMPFGIKSASEVFQKIMSQMLEDISGAEVIIDDILVWGSSIEEHDQRLRRVLQRAKEYNLKLSKQKCEVRKTEVKYVGQVLTQKGVKPDPEKVRAISMMQKPENRQELLTFLGLVQYLGKFLPRLSDVSAPLRKLTETAAGSEWNWNKEQEVSFKTIKAMIIEAPVLAYYDPKQPLTLSVDASSKGLGATILQQGRPIAYASRALTAAQRNYAQIEKEALAVVFGCHKFHHYIYGRQITVESDHKPLESIFRKPLLAAPMRLQRLLLAVQKYDLKIEYKPGKLMFIADALSRHYLDETTEELVPEVDVNSITLNQHLPMSKDRYTEFQQETLRDSTLQQLLHTVLSGWPEAKQNLQSTLIPYWSFRDEISHVDGLLFKGSKLLIPKSMQQKMLDLVHESHLGIVKCKSRARECMYWPGMAAQIEDKVSKCHICAEVQNSNPKEPMICTELPDRPWSKIASDIFAYQQNHYIIAVDYYSKWLEIKILKDLSSCQVVNSLKSMYSKYGIPDELVSDNGPQYTSKEFKDFTKEYGFTHTTSSPLYPKSNGQAERMVQTVKRILKKNKDPYIALMDYRNTEIQGLGKSPAQMFLGRRLKTKLPTTAKLLRSMNNDTHEKLKSRQLNFKRFHDRNATKNLPDLQAGDRVMLKVQNSWKHANIESKHHQPKSFIVSCEGKQYRRNRSRMKQTKSIKETSEVEGFDFQLPDSVSQQIPGTTRPNSDNASEHPNCDRETEQARCTRPKQTLSFPTPPQELNKTRSGRTIKAPGKYADYVMPTV